MKKALSSQLVTRAKPRSTKYDVYAKACPTRVVLDHVADKWLVLVLGRLVEKPVRFNELRREVDGISQKVLSQTLKTMERDGLVQRRVFATVPVTVEYSSTALGKTLASKVVELGRWAEENIQAITAAQKSYDARAAKSA